MKPILPLISCMLLLLLVLSACGGKNTRKSTSSESFRSSTEAPQQNKNVFSGIRTDYDKAVDLMQQKEYRRAETLFKKVLQASPELSGPYINLGIIRLNEGDLEESEKYFEEAIKRNGRSPQAFNYLGIIHRQKGSFKLAEDAYLQALSLDKNYAAAYLNLGVLYDLYMSNFSAALKNYKQYLTFNPNDKRVENWVTDINQRMRATN